MKNSNTYNELLARNRAAYEAWKADPSPANAKALEAARRRLAKALARMKANERS